MDRSPELACLILNVLIVLAVPAWRRIILPPLSADGQPAAAAGTQRFQIFDLAKGFAILAVIIIHVAGLLLEYYPEAPSQLLYFLDNVSRFAIPVFVTCSGLLLNPDSPSSEKLSSFFGRKILRSFLPYVVCSTVIMLYWNAPLTETVYALFTGKAAPPYYFMVVLFQLYLAFPFLVRIRKFRWFLPAAFLISLFVFITGIGWMIESIPLGFRYLFFFALGMRLRDSLLTERIDRQSAVSAALVCLLYVLSSMMFQGVYSNVQLTFGPAALILIFSLRAPLEKGSRLLMFVARTGRSSLWIFLLHFALVEFIVWHLSGAQMPFYPALLITLLLSPLVSLPTAFLADKAYLTLLKRFGI